MYAQIQLKFSKSLRSQRTILNSRSVDRSQEKDQGKKPGAHAAVYRVSCGRITRIP